MRIPSYLIPPSSHFLKSLINFLSGDLDFKNPEVSGFYIVFPTKRACYYFKHLLIQKFNGQSLFFPRVLAWEEFLQKLYLEICETPKLLLPDSAKIFFLLQSLDREKLRKDPTHLLFWGSKFLEVFEEFEKEGKLPPNLLYPPEGIPDTAQALFEELAKIYDTFKELLKEKGVLFPLQLLSEISELLLKRESELKIKGLVMAGFAALREAEKELWQKLFEVLKNTPIYLFFESNHPPHPILQETFKALKIEASLLPDNFLDRLPSKPEIKLFSFPDIESEVSKVMENLPSELKRADQVAIILPQPLTLLPLLHRLETTDLEVNITLPVSSRILPIYHLFKLLIKAQRERRGNYYLTEDILKILRFPLLRLLIQEEGLWEKILNAIKEFLKKEKPREISFEELLNIVPDLLQQELFEKVWQILFKNFENPDSPENLKNALLRVLEFLSPALQKKEEVLNETLDAFFLRGYLAFLEKEVLPLFDYSPLWKGLDFEDKKDFYLRILDFLLSQGKISLSGEPLAGVQIMGLLEARLLYFDRIILLDVNEGALPPATPLNPLLTDEIKTYLGLPIFKNELWDYYFEQILFSAPEVNLYYILTSKGKGELTGEPSRFIQKYKWLSEKNGSPLKEETFKPELKPLTRIEGIPKKAEDKEILLAYLKRGSLSRFFFETYITCPVRFYFKYLLGLDSPEEISLQDRDIGLFLHAFFEKLFGAYQGRAIYFSEITQKGKWEALFEELWKEFGFERSLDPLSLWLSEKIARASIANYLQHLYSLEREGTIKRFLILGVEKDLEYKTNLHSYDIKLWGRVDFIVKREEAFPKYCIFDFKSNPYKKPAPSALKKLLNFTPRGDFSLEELSNLQECFGKDLTNFQLIFYLFLLLKNKETLLNIESYSEVEINAGYLTPSNFKEPEKFLITKSNYKERSKFFQFLEEDFESLLDFVLTHILESPAFYFTENEEACKFCDYKSPCLNLRT